MDYLYYSYFASWRVFRIVKYTMLTSMRKILRKLEIQDRDEEVNEDVDYGNRPVTVHPKTCSPVEAWDEIRVKQYFKRIEPMPLDTPVYPDKVRFVCISDTHNVMHLMKHPLPPGDVLIHGGDFTRVGKVEKVIKFNECLGCVPIKHRIVIAGNHDLSFDDELMKDDSRKSDLVHYFRNGPEQVEKMLEQAGVEHVKELLTNCTYLQDQETSVYGIRLYGSPWQPEFGDWGFNLPRGQPCLDKWEKIPEGVDVLVTHGPPIGHGDQCKFGQRAGCVELLHTIQRRVKPKYHVFGHVHEDAGVTTDSKTTYINASICNLLYRPHNPPIIFDLPLPPGKTKQDYDVQDHVTGPVDQQLSEESEGSL